MSSGATQVRDGSPGYGAKANAQGVPPGYKRTEIGVIPMDWGCSPIVDVARLESGHTPSRRRHSYWNGRVPWVSLHDTESLDGAFITATALTITEEGLANSSARLLPEGTVVFSRTATVGKSTLLGRPMATSQDFANYICGPRLHNRYLVYLFRSMRSVWQRFMAGSIHNTVYMPVFESLRIALPPVNEQRAIAEALSDVDGLLGALDALIVKKRAIKQAAMQQLLTGNTRLPGFSGEWETKRLGEVADIEMGQSPSSAFYNTNGTGLPLIQGNADIANRRTVRRIFTTQITKRGRRGDILLSVRAPVGEVSRATFDVCLGRGVCAIRFPNDFLFHYLVYLEPSWARHSKGSTFDSVNSTDVRAVEVHLPDPDEQAAITNVLSDMDAEIAALEARRDKTRAIKQGMMQQLLTGRVRLVKPQTEPAC
jgi:type I restriction enzyme S subunit